LLKHFYRRAGSFLPQKQRTQLIQTVTPHWLQRWYRLNHTDLFLLSYPKCGRTWLRVLMTRAIANHYRFTLTNYLDTAQLANLDDSIPKINVLHDDLPHTRRSEELEISKKAFQKGKVLFLARDPRDVIVSLYFHLSKRHQQSIHSLSSFMRGEVGGFETILQYYNIWEQNRQLPKDFLLVRYEDLHTQPVAELERIFAFMELPAFSPAAIQEAIQFATFNNMRKLEQNKTLGSVRLQPGDPNDLSSYKTRKGKVGDFVNHFSEEDIAYMNERMQAKMPASFGYLPAESATSHQPSA